MHGKWVKTVFVIVAIIALFACIATTNKKSRKVTLLEGIINDIIVLPQNMYAYARAYITNNDEFFAQVDDLKAKNEVLESRVKELEEKLIICEEIVAENNLLKEHMNVFDSYTNYDVVVADIISDSASNWEATYIINKGSNDGIKPGMTVIAEKGLVGYVETVTKNTSKIISILDAGNSVTGRVTRTRDEVICKGSISSLEEQKLKVTDLPIGTVLIEGDRIETAGTGGIYSKGIKIGKVSEIINKKNPMENEAIITPEVDFEKLETVAIIVNNADEETDEGGNNE